MKIFRNIIAILVVFFVTTLIYMALRYLFIMWSPKMLPEAIMSWFSQTSFFEHISASTTILLALLLGFILCAIAFGVTVLTSKIADNRKVRIISAIIPSVYCGIWYIYSTWKIHAAYVTSACFTSIDVSVSMVMSIVFTLFYICLSAAFIIPAIVFD